MKNSNETIENRTRDLRTCSALNQPNGLPRAPTKGLYVSLIFCVHFNNIGILYYVSQALSQNEHLEDSKKFEEFLVSSGFLNHYL